MTAPTNREASNPKPAQPPVGGSGISSAQTFSPEDAGYVCDLLRNGKTDPGLWTRQERRAVTRLHELRGPL